MMLRTNEKECEKEEITSSSKCSSGWTTYLDRSYEKPNSGPLSRTVSVHQYRQQQEEEEEEDEEDLSMVSDASSGPPHVNDDEVDQHSYHGNGKKRRVEKKMQTVKLEIPHSPLLDDTASSPFLSLSKSSCNGTTTNNKKKKLLADDSLERSCGFSATQFKGKSALRKHMGYFKSCVPIKQTSVSMDEGEEKLW